MSRHRAAIASLAALGLLAPLGLAAAAEDADTRLAARVGGEWIRLEDVDRPSQPLVDALHARLTAVAQAALNDLIARRLGAGDAGAITGEAPPIAESAVDAFRAEQVTLLLPPADALETALPAEQIVARTDSTQIHAAELEQAAALRLYRLRGELYRERMRNLEARIEERLLDGEARRRGMLPAELEAALQQPDPVSDAELEAFVARERAAGREVTNPERARPYLVFRKVYQRRAELLAELRAGAAIEIYLSPPVRPRLTVETTGGHSLGDAQGLVLVAFTNYRCRACRATHREIDRLLGGQPPVRIVLRDFVPVYDPTATEAAALARCAARQGGLAGLRTALLARDPPAYGHPWFSALELDSLARQAGIAMTALRKCAGSVAVRRAIERDSEAARRLGFDEAPAFVAEGVPLSGMQSAEDLLGALQEGRSDVTVRRNDAP